jgi:beta-xylosidase
MRFFTVLFILMLMNGQTQPAPMTVPPPPAAGRPWLPDRGDGTYCNPVLYADYSDPDAIRVGDDYYLVASSFTCTPGLPILHSKDLVNWTIIGHALDHLPDPRYEKVLPGCGVWAPAIRFHAGKYWIFYPTPDEGIFLVTATNPAGPWSAPHLVQEGKGLIDPCPFWDDDGKAYLVHAYAGSRAGIKHRLRVRPMAPDGSKLLGEGEIIYNNPAKHPTLEGPKFMKRDGWYYILAPAGGVETGWQVVLRSKNIYGPYEDKIVLSQGRTDINGPHQGALVDTPAGGWWFLHFQDAGLYGRILHLQPVHWQDGWALMGVDGEPVRRYAKPIVIPGQTPCAPATSDDFDVAQLGLQWQWQANYHDDWYSLTARPGWLRLFPQATVTPAGEQPNFLLQKFPAPSFTAETLLDFAPRQDGEEAGLVVTGGTPFLLGVRHEGGTNRMVLRVGDRQDILAEAGGQPVRLRVQVVAGGHCSFSFSTGGKFLPVPGTFPATKGVWVGAKLGLYSLKPAAPAAAAGHADFDYFHLNVPNLEP